MHSKPDKIKPALIGGAALGIASAIPLLNCLNCACCALVIGGGFLAAFLYLQEAGPSPEPLYGDGAIVGLLAGIVGAVASSIVAIPIQLMTAGLGLAGDPGEILQSLEEAGVELPSIAEQAISSMGGGGFAFTAIVIGLFFNLGIYSVFATLGGILGAAVLHKKPTSEGYNTAPPPPPAVA